MVVSSFLVPSQTLAKETLASCPRACSPCAGLPSCIWRRWSTADQGGDKNRSTSNSPCFSLVVVICIAVWETPFYGIMQAGQKLGIVYIGKAGGKVCAETFRLVSFTYLYLIWSRTTSWFVILQFNLLMFSWSVISVVS